MNKTLSPPSRVRVTVPVTPEVLEAFQRMAKAGNMSTGKAMATWLEDTIEAVEFMGTKMEQARAAPKLVMREMHAYALGLADETGDLIRALSAKGKADRAAAGGGHAGACAPPDGAVLGVIPPSCNTGGKLPRTQAKPRGGNSK